MYIKMLKAPLAGLILSVSGLANAGLIEYINNGDFETGDFTGWTVANTGNGAWNTNDGSFVTGGFGSVAPIGGSFDAITSQTGPGFHSLSQNILLSNSFDTAILSWDDRIQSGIDFSEHNQEWRVLIKDLSGALIAEVFSTNPGDLTSQFGPNSRSFDLTSILNPFAGQSINISFEEEDNLSFFSASLDNVSFTTSVPEPSSLAIFALGIMGLASRRSALVSKKQ